MGGRPFISYTGGKTLLLLLFVLLMPGQECNGDWREAVSRSMLLEKAGKYQEARSVLVGALEEARRHPEDLLRAGTVLWRLGWVSYSLGELDEAAMRYRASLAQLEKALGREHPTVALVLSGYGSVHEARRDAKQAERLRLRALEILKQHGGPGLPEALALRADLARGYFQRNNYAHAETELRAVISEWPSGGETRDARLGQAWSSLGYVLLKMGRKGEAGVAFETSLEITADLAGRSHPIHLDATFGLAQVRAEENRLAEANERLMEAQFQVAALGDSHPLVLQVLETRQGVLRRMGLRAEARELEDIASSLRKNKIRLPASVSLTGLSGEH